MTSERENNISSNNGLGMLSMRRYDIEGNKIRAFFDDADNLIFVIDDTVTPDKPNALLVINSDDGRKWDDILSNDYDVSLEMVRPKKNNKYQKLDIEYLGLDEYDDLIRDADDMVDLADSLTALAEFRAEASFRAATERLQAAESVAENARETISRAQDSIEEQQEKIKNLRTKLSQQKKSVGREPTKQSAAKILRTESQIDALKDKQARAQKRLDNARRRLIAAEEDAEVAREILNRYNNKEAVVEETEEEVSLPVAAPTRTVATVRRKPQPTVVVKEVKEIPAAPTNVQFLEEPLEPKAEDMAEEVKPLFDKDPEILDEEIAFKPIDFGTSTVSSPAPTEVSAPSRFEEYAEPTPVEPLAFVPPSSSEIAPTPETRPTMTQNSMTSLEIVTPEPAQQQAPMFDSMASFGTPAEPAVQPAPQPSSMWDTITSVEMPAEMTEQPAPVMPSANPYVDTNAAAPVSAPAPTHNVGPAMTAVPGAAAAPMRPMGPVKGTPALQAGEAPKGRRPSLLYYLLLILLIVLSVFTLWLYQTKNNGVTPDLTATAPEKVEEKVEPAPKEPEPFIQVEEQVTVTPIPEPEPEPVPVIPEPEPEPVVPFVDETVPALPVLAEPPHEPESPFITEPEPEPEKKPVVVNKPVYNAGSRNENMFVASDDYDTDVVVAAAPAPELEPAPVIEPEPELIIEEVEPDVDIAEPQSLEMEVASELIPLNGGAAAEYDEMVESQSELVCEGGEAPTEYGCCGDEMYTEIGGGAYACCSESTGQCYPPLF